MPGTRTLIAILTCVGVYCTPLSGQDSGLPVREKVVRDPQRFAGAIGAFARQDRENGIPKGKTVFVGSSSVARLDRETVFPDHPMTLRGLRGGRISDLNHYAEELVLQYEPSRVVFFCGGNDLWNGDTPEEVLANFDEFTKKLFQRAPRCRLIQLAIRPSMKKRTIIPLVLRTNQLLQQFADADERIVFLRGACDRFLDEDGESIEPLYHEDRNHMNASGYTIWSEIVTPHLGAPVDESQTPH
ncbi:MAG: GDSL-type esterase/lipase family protein [Planctomycetota bacterium]